MEQSRGSLADLLVTRVMTPKELLKTIYLGDRFCKSILIDGCNQRVAIQVNVISRVRGTSGNWDFYTAEDIPDGRLVFSGVRGIRFDPPGPVPNDLINEIRVTGVHEIRSGQYVHVFVLSIGSVSQAAESTEVTIEIRADTFHIEDPRHPGEIIAS
jgi:hypothetical protein